LDSTDLTLDAAQAPEIVVFGHRVATHHRPPPSAASTTDRNRRSRRLLLTTKTLEKAMAAPAIIGLRRPSAASGTAATLYANAQKRLPLMVARVRRLSRMASTVAVRSPRTSVRSAA